MDYEQAKERVFEWTQNLAILPPPTEEDEQGFSTATDAPLRQYLARAHAGLATLDEDYAAVSYLRMHSKRQLDREEWEEAFAAIRKEWRARNQRLGERAARVLAAAPAEAEPVKGEKERPDEEEKGVRLALKTRPASDGEVGGELEHGQYRWEGNSLRVKLPMRRNVRASNAFFEKAGLIRNDEFKWANIPDKDEAERRRQRDPERKPDPELGEWTIRVHPSALVKFALAIREGWPRLATIILSHAERWMAEAGTPVPSADSSAPAPTAYSPHEGQVGQNAWRWSEDDPESIYVKNLGLDVSKAATNVGVPVRYDGGWNSIRRGDARALVGVLKTFPHLRELATVFEGLLPAWESYKVEIATEEVLRAKQLARRFQYMMTPESRAAGLEKLEEAIASSPALLRVRPGDTSADLGAYGRWEVQPAGPITQQSQIYLYMPFALKHWAAGLNGVKLTKDSKDRWANVSAIRNVPAIARRLDTFSPPLALSLRVALLTEVLRECPELEQLAGALSPAEVADPVVRAQVEAIAADVNSKLGPGYKLRPYQEVGVAFAAFSGYRALIGDAMGVGKTATAIGAILHDIEGNTPALVVAPASVAYNWMGEGGRWAPPLKFTLVESSTDLGSLAKRGNVLVVSWGALAQSLEALSRVPFKLMVIDESHYGKNAKASRTKAAIALSQKIPRRLLLSGTAMENEPGELWSQLHMVDPSVFPDYKAFKAKYSSDTQRVVGSVEFRDDRRAIVDLVKEVPQDSTADDGIDDFDEEPDEEEPESRRRKGGKKSLSASKLLVLQELREQLRCFMVRRLKHEVLPDLPEKTRSYVWSPLPPRLRRIYDEVQENMASWLGATWRAKAIRKAVALHATKGLSFQLAADAVNAEAPDVSEAAGMAIVTMGYLRRLVGEAKAEAAAEWIIDFTEQNPGQGLVVFVDHQRPLEVLGAALDAAKVHWTKIDGGTLKKARAKRVQGFLDGEYDVLIGTRALAEGVNLQSRASDGVFVERWWVPSKEEQAEDRLHRLGQRNAVHWRYFMAQNTMDNRIHELVDAKRAMIEAVLSGEGTKEETTGSAGGGKELGIAGGILQSLIRATGRALVEPSEVERAFLTGVFPPLPSVPAILDQLREREEEEREKYRASWRARGRVVVDDEDDESYADLLPSDSVGPIPELFSEPEPEPAIPVPAPAPSVPDAVSFEDLAAAFAARYPKWVPAFHRYRAEIEQMMADESRAR